MLETTRIRKEGYAYRPTFGDFLNRFKMLGFPFGVNPAANAASCGKVLEVAGCKGWQVGKTKVPCAATIKTAR
jgi:myosin-3